MFAVGDKVVYPMHGAGVVKTIEKRERDVHAFLLFLLLRRRASDIRLSDPGNASWRDEGHGSGRQCGTCWLEACYRK